MKQHRADNHSIGKPKVAKAKKSKGKPAVGLVQPNPISPGMETQTSASPVSAHELQQAVNMIAPPAPAAAQVVTVTYPQVIVQGYHTVPVVSHPQFRPGWTGSHDGMQRH